MENIKDFARKYKLDIVIFVVIFAIAIFLRTYKLDEIPAGINVDEAGMAYDAFCLSKFKVDRALNHLPVYLGVVKVFCTDILQVFLLKYLDIV